MRYRRLVPLALAAPAMFAIPVGPVRAAPEPSTPCAAALPVTSGSFPEVHGKTTRGTLWALLFYAPPAKTGTQEKIVIRATGKGTMHVTAIGPNGTRRKPTWGPEFHESSSWNRPGAEWGTGWTFGEAGCWHLHVKRTGESGNIWLQVDPAA
jgi:hypothetical protein